MTYNVFGGTLNLAESINPDFNTVLLPKLFLAYNICEGILPTSNCWKYLYQHRCHTTVMEATNT